jgi:hypothetical protein
VRRAQGAGPPSRPRNPLLLLFKNVATVATLATAAQQAPVQPLRGGAPPPRPRRA